MRLVSELPSEEALAKAEAMRDANARETMLAVAAMYRKMAERARQREA